MDELAVKEAIGVILRDTKAHDTSLDWAVGYCEDALPMTGHALKIQCLYILNNITHWRNPKAKEVRASLKNFAKTH